MVSALMLAGFFMGFHTIAALMAIGIDIGAKWMVIGRRVTGPQVFGMVTA